MKLLKSIAWDLIGFAGLCSVTYGFWLIRPAIGFIAFGAGLVVVALIGARNASG